MAKVVEIRERFEAEKFKMIGLIIGALILVMIVLDGFVAVPAGHVAVIFDMGRGVLEEEYGEGLHLKIPFWQSATIMDGRTQEYTMSIIAGEGIKQSDDSIESRSRDGQVIWVDATVLFHIDKSNASKIKQTLGVKEDYFAKIIRPRAREIIRLVIARYNAIDLVSEVRPEIVRAMSDELRQAYAKHNIVLEEVVMRNVTYSPEFANAVEQKEVARQRIKTTEYEKEQAEFVKQKKIVEAEGEAEAIRLKGEVLKSYPEVIQLEFVNKLAPEIDWGILPDSITPFFNVPGV